MLKYNDVLSKLENKKKSSEGYTAKCPCHDDKSNSLSVTEKDGKVLFYCHAGCDQKDVYEALKNDHYVPDYEEKPAIITKSKPQKSQKEKSEFQCAYDYVDPSGTLVYQIVRYKVYKENGEIGKKFMVRRPYEGGWTYNRKGIKLYPYNLVNVLAAKKAVCLVEGEKDADNLIKIGVTATTTPFGVGKWDDEYTEYFRDKNVIIFPDNDKPSRDHFEDVAFELNKVAMSVKIVNLPDLEEKQDISDYLEKGYGRADLIKLINKAPYYSPSEAKSKEKKQLKVFDHPAKVFDKNWESKLMFKSTGEIITNTHNMMLYLKNHPDVADAFAFDKQLCQNQLIKRPPWLNPNETLPMVIDDNQVMLATAWLNTKMFNATDILVGRVISSVCKNNTYNSLQDYLKKLMWDGKPRIDKLFVYYCRAKDTEYHRLVGRKFCISAVARALKPGSKVDNMIILEGKQGIKKSTFIETLFGENFFTDHLDTLGSKECVQQMIGKWGIELAELHNLESVSDNLKKGFISRKTDKIRLPYDKNTTDIPRTCVFIGTTNQVNGTYLTDSTGERRYWPVICSGMNLDAVRKDRDQIWAEAVKAFRSDEKWYFEGADNKMVKEEQQQRTVIDPLTDKIMSFVDAKHSVTVAEILEECLNLSYDKFTRSIEMRVSNILKLEGWEKSRKMYNGKRLRLYVRKEDMLPK